MPEPYLYASGLHRLAETLHGDEAIYGGTVQGSRLHPGQRLAMIAYPVLLARALRTRDVEPRLQLLYFVPDWASDELGHAPSYRLNLVPRGRTYQHQPDPHGGCHANRAEHWQAAFESELAPVREAISQADVQVVRTSSLSSNADFRAVLRMALRRPGQVREALQEALPDEAILEQPLQFAGPVCRACHSIEGRMEYIEGWDRVQFQCVSCGNVQEADIREQDFWAHEHVLEAAVQAALRPAVVIVDGDAARTGHDVAVNAIVARALKDAPEPPAQLVAPVVMGGAGDDEASLERLLALAAEWDEGEVGR